METLIGMIVAFIMWYSIEESSLDELCYTMVNDCIWYACLNIDDDRITDLSMKSNESTDRFVSKFSTRSCFIYWILKLRNSHSIYKGLHMAGNDLKAMKHKAIRERWDNTRFNKETAELNEYISVNIKRIVKDKVNVLKNNKYLEEKTKNERDKTSNSS